jgi:hypothetical protein
VSGIGVLSERPAETPQRQQVCWRVTIQERLVHVYSVRRMSVWYKLYGTTVQVYGTPRGLLRYWTTELQDCTPGSSIRRRERDRMVMDHSLGSWYTLPGEVKACIGRKSQAGNKLGLYRVQYSSVLSKLDSIRHLVGNERCRIGMK